MDFGLCFQYLCTCGSEVFVFLTLLAIEHDTLLYLRCLLLIGFSTFMVVDIAVVAFEYFDFLPNDYVG